MTLTSPLSEVDKNSLAQLFSKDPLSLTTSDLSIICDELRAQRARWQQEERAKPAPGQKKQKVLLSQSELDDILNAIA